MKKILILLLALIFAFSTAVFGVACEGGFGGNINLGGGQDNTGDGGNTDDGSNDNDGNQGSNPSAPAVFEQDGLTYTLQSNNTYTVTACNKSTSGAEITVLGEIEGVKVTAIGDDVFENHKTVTKVTLPDSVTYIGVSAFNTCSKLTTVNLGKVKVIDKTAFKSSALNACDLSSLVEMGEGAFASTKLKSVTIPNGITEIPNQTFSDCVILKTVVLPTSVVEIGQKAFVNCPNLKTINLENVKTFGDYAFQSCSALTSITLTSAVYIKDWAFASCGLKEVYIGNDCIQIYLDAFTSCSSLKTVDLASAHTKTWFILLVFDDGTTGKYASSKSYPEEWRERIIKDPTECKDFLLKKHQPSSYIGTSEYFDSIGR